MPRETETERTWQSKVLLSSVNFGAALLRRDINEAVIAGTLLLPSIKKTILTSKLSVLLSEQPPSVPLSVLGRSVSTVQHAGVEVLVQFIVVEGLVG